MAGVLWQTGRVSLEDHIGDVCRKARLQTGIQNDTAAAVAGLSEAQLQEWETEGVIQAPVNVAALAERLGLDAAKALRVAEGWVDHGGDVP